MAVFRNAFIRQRLLVAALVAATATPAWATTASSGHFDPSALTAKANAGDATAAFELGTLYSAGYGVVQDYLASAKWLRQAADRGNADAACELGMLYQTSTYADTPPQDLPKATQWYKKAADQGNGCGLFALAALYDAGKGVPHDPVKAADLYKAAAAKGYALDKSTFPLEQVYARFHALAARLAGVSDPNGTN